MGQQLARQQQEAKDAVAATAATAAEERARLTQEACAARDAQAQVKSAVAQALVCTNTMCTCSHMHARTHMQACTHALI